MTADAIAIADAPEQERFEARDPAGELAGIVSYQLTGNIIAYTHTQVLPEYRGQGLGGQLARAVMDDAKAHGRTVVPICPFLAGWLDKHPEYDGSVARRTKKVK